MKTRPNRRPATLSLALLLLAAVAPAIGTARAAEGGENLISALPTGWESWSPRPALAPTSDVVQADGATLLRMRAKDAASYGEWHRTVPGIHGGQTYRFEVRYRPADIAQEGVSAPIMLIWRNEKGRAVRYDYVSGISSEAGGWRLATRTLPAPADAAALTVKLILRWTAAGSIVWKEPSLLPAEAKPHRKIRVVTTCIQPGPHPTVQKNTDLMAETFDMAGALKPDLVLFTEVFVDREVRRPVTETAQTIPGPATEMLSERARRYHTWVATSIHESDHGLIYNTAVLIDRQGRIAGKYHKVHLVVDEAEDGITPGSDYPVFDTDFGKVGIQVCWDDWFQEGARALRLKGAEIILLPLAGDGSGLPWHWDVIARARAIDNSVFLIASSAHPHSASVIIDPDGRLLASTAGGIASMDIDLDKSTYLHGFGPQDAAGEPREVYVRERHPETYAPLLEPEQSLLNLSPETAPKN